MTKHKILSVFIAAVMIFSLSFAAFGADFSQVEEDIAFLNEHQDIISLYYKERIKALTEKFEQLKNSNNANEEEITAVAAELSGIGDEIRNCLEGNHSYDYLSADCIPPLCTCLAVCPYCNDEKVVLSGNGYREQHNDYDGDDVCDACKRVMPYVGCSHICHSKNVIVQRLIMPILRFFWDYFGVEKFCTCGMYHG